MSFRPTRSLVTPPRPGAIDVLEYEVAQEKGATLSRITRSFERALAAYRADPQSEALLDAAGAAVWCFVVQRESCGLRNTEAVLREYEVPAAVRLRLGVTRR